MASLFVVHRPWRYWSHLRDSARGGLPKRSIADVLIGMGLLRSDRLNDWRRGRVPCLERVIGCNLTRLSRLLRILRFHAHDLDLRPSATVYMRYGKGPKQRLRFSKTGDTRIEAAYSTHFVWTGKRSFHATRAEPAPCTNALDRANAAKT